MKKQIVFIIDTNEISKEQWDSFKGLYNYAAWIHEDDRDSICDFVDKKQDDRLESERKARG